MIKDDCHWKPIKQVFMRHDLVCGPVELQVPAEHFYPGRQRFNHLKGGWCMLWRIEREANAANPLLVEQAECEITDVWAQYSHTPCTVKPHLRNSIHCDGVVRIVISGRYHDGAVDFQCALNLGVSRCRARNRAHIVSRKDLTKTRIEYVKVGIAGVARYR